MKWKGRWQNWSWGFLRVAISRYPLEQAFEDASRFGYDYIELWGGYPHAYVEDLTARGVGEIDRLIQKYRMPVKCFTPGAQWLSL